MRLLTSIAAPALLSYCVSAVNIYVASANGNLTTLSLTQNTFASSSSSQYVENGYFAGAAPSKTYNLSVVSTQNTSAKAPAWLTYNPQNHLLYLTDGTTTGNGTVSSFRTHSTGAPVPLSQTECLLDGAHAEFFANGNALAVAHYSASALQTYKITNNGSITPLQTFTYNLTTPGPDGSRQLASHPHMSLLDPTDQYLLVMDLGADLVRVYAVNRETSLLTEKASLVAARGSGPRHGVFSREPVFGAGNSSSSNYVFYLDAEIAGTVTSYSVTYLPNQEGLQFDEIESLVTLAPGVPFPAVTKAGGPGVSAEIRLTSDGDFLIISNRRDNSFNGTITQYPPNGTSDSIVTYRVRNDLGGKLDFLQTVPVGGAVPRSYALNQAQTLAAVGVQLSSKVTILERNPVSGLFTEQVAEVDVDGQLMGIVWDEV